MIVEVLGWAGRTWNSDCPYNSTAFMIQISTLIIGKFLLIAIEFITTKKKSNIPSSFLHSSCFLHRWYLHSTRSLHQDLRPGKLIPHTQALSLDLLHLRRSLPRYPSSRRWHGIFRIKWQG